MELEEIKQKLAENPLCFTSAVLIETTNRCNFASSHPLCPASKVKERKTLSIDLIKKIIGELKEYDFSGTIYPFFYSEPLTDPRMFSVIKLIKKELPKARVWLYSNGYNIDETMLRELREVGANRLNISIYNVEDDQYFHKLLMRLREENFPMILRGCKRYPMFVNMNDKITWYDREPLNKNSVCKAPLKYLTITAYGELLICCHDWEKMHIFGNINEQSLSDVLKGDKVVEAYYYLTHGQRDKFYLCARCSKHR